MVLQDMQSEGNLLVYIAGDVICPATSPVPTPTPEPTTAPTKKPKVTGKATNRYTTYMYMHNITMADR